MLSNKNPGMDILYHIFTHVPRVQAIWDARDCYQEMFDATWKNASGNTWHGWYFEYLMAKADVPGVSHFKPKIGSTEFDGTAGSRIVDYKASADPRSILLNDQENMIAAIETYSEIGYIILDGDGEKEENNEATDFRYALFGKSAYVLKREAAGRPHRKIWLKFAPRALLYLSIDKDNITQLPDFNQGVNSNGSNRKKKFLINKDELQPFLRAKIEFPTS